MSPIEFSSPQIQSLHAQLLSKAGTQATEAVQSPAEGEQLNQFTSLMLQSIDHVNAMQQEADKAVEMLATGGDVQTAEVLTSMQKADMTFRLMLQIRNKLMQAYQEINQIRI